MSVSMYESAVRRHRGEMEKARVKQADFTKKANDADKRARDYESAARTASSASSAKSKSGQADRKHKEAQAAREKARAALEAAGKAEVALNAAQVRLDEGRAKERKKQDDRRDVEERQAERRRQGERRAQEHRERERDREFRGMRGQLSEQERWLREIAIRQAPAEITVLFIAASPEDQDRLRLDREVREVQRRVRESGPFRNVLTFEYRLAARPEDLVQAFNETQPAVVHFSGHGDHAGLAFEKADGTTKMLDNARLGSLLSTFADGVRLAIFNSCESAEQAELACSFIDAAIGMDQPVGDEVALAFAGQFYNSLGFGLPLQTAFDQARTHADISAVGAPGLPRLHAALGVDPETTYLVAPAEDAT